MSQQQANLNRVFGAISSLVQRFCCELWDSGRREFVMRDLHDFIAANSPIAPASPDRILREARLRGSIGYEVIDRAKSRYRLTSVPRGAKKIQGEMF